MIEWLKNMFGGRGPKSVRTAARKAKRRPGVRREPGDVAAALMAMSGTGGGMLYRVADGVGGGTVQARYDLAQTTDGNRKHWAAADGMSADAANSLGVRRVMRNRTRYEVANNSYVKGMVRTLAKDTVGIGPLLQMLVAEGKRKPKSLTQVEADFADWAREIKLAKKLRILRRAKCETGEAFAVVFTNPALQSIVKLDIRIVEADRVTDVSPERWNDPLWCDGIHYDEYGNPVSYRIYKHHPGGPYPLVGGGNDFSDYPAEFVFHYFADDERPEQRRGIPELSPSVQTGGELRRYDNAVLRTAEVHARMAMALQSDVTPELEAGEEDPESPDTMDTVELPDSGAIVLPPGMKLSGVAATQPTDTHKDFVNTKLRETARCIDMPFTIAAMDSSVANMSARYLDSQIYAASIKVERADLEGEFLDWLLLKHWAPEYWLVKPNAPRGVDRYAHTWRWPSLNQHADPAKVANAAATRLDAGITSLADEVAENGDDWEDAEAKEARVLGVTVEQLKTLRRLKRFGTADPDGKPMPVVTATPTGNKPAPAAPNAADNEDNAGADVPADNAD